MRTGSRRHRISTVFQIPGRRADSLRIGRYTNFLDTTQSGGDHHESGVQQVGVGVRGRPDGRRRDRPHRPPREAGPVPRRVLPRPPCPHAGGLAAQKACALPMLKLLNFRCSFCSNPLDETQSTKTAAEILLDPTPDMHAMPRFGDGDIDMQELFRRLTEQT